MTGLFVVFVCFGLVVPAAMAMSLDPHPEIAGLAASSGGTAQMLIGGLMIALSGPFMDNSASTMVAAICVCACLALAAAAMSRTR